MLKKCECLGKYHLCFGLNVGPLYTLDMVAEAILLCIPEDLRLSDLFQKWSTLSPEDQNALDERLPVGRNDLYVALKKALMRWESVQDTLGAPGFESGLFAFTCNDRLNDGLESLIGQIYAILGPPE